MIHFGTGGWRAIIADEFTRANVQLLTAALADKMEAEGVAKKGLVIGYDRRFLSEVAAQWIAEVLAYRNIPVRLINREAPTPLIMYAVEYYNLPYGMAVTASHNPAHYNGIKVFTEGGRDADEVHSGQLEAYMEKLDGKPIPILPYDEAMAKGLVEIINPMNQYVDAIIRMVNMDAIRSRGLKIALDPMFGVSKTALQTVLITARCDVDLIHERRDTLFGGKLPAPNPKTMASLQSYVLDNGCDLGIATDGDADRLGVIDDAGTFLHPNKILAILYYYLLKYRGWKGPAVRNIATTHLLDCIAEAFGEQCYEVPVGFKHVSSKMTETNAVIGGESSGGLTVRGHIQGKDGIFAAALLVEMIATTGKPLSALYREITDQFGEWEMVEHDFSFSEKKKAAVKKKLMEDKALPEFPMAVKNVSYADGCKIYFEHGWLICRFSGTEPLLRVFCEMETEAAAEEMCRFMAEFLDL